MRLLVDTHAAVRWFNDPTTIRRETRELLENTANDVPLSATSVWEAGLEGAAGRLDVPVPLGESARRWGLRELQISWRHATLGPSFHDSMAIRSTACSSPRRSARSSYS